MDETCASNGRWSADYKELMHQCDNAMREHYIAKKAVEFTPSETTVATLQATELSHGLP